jgi:hypothetical protein
MKDDVIGMKLMPTLALGKRSLFVAAAVGIFTSSCAGPSANRSLQSSLAPLPANSIRLTSLSENPQEDSGVGLVYQANFDPETPLIGPAEPYHPQAGDIFLSTDQLWIARLGHKLAGASSPHHSGLVIMLPDGRPGMLESGPHDTLFVRVLKLRENLGQYEEERESIWIRRRKTPLTEEQSKALTDFALKQNGKLFAWGRVIGQLTPFRSRGPWTEWVGGPHGGDRVSYFCSELALETLVAAGLLDATRTRPAATYPCDLFYGRSNNEFINDHLDVNVSWEPPARWTSTPQPAIMPTRLAATR